MASLSTPGGARFSFGRGALVLLAVLLGTWAALALGGWRVRAFVSGTTDLASYFIPKYQYAADRIAAGELPQWNPYEFGGIPFLATIQPAVFYPPLRVAYALLSGETAYRAFYVAHLLIAALGTLLLARDLSLAMWPAVLAALWVAQPTLLVRLYDHGLFIGALAWLPLVILVSRRIVQAPSARTAALLAVLATLMILIGYPPLVLATAYLVALGLPLWWLELRDDRDAARTRGALLALLGAAVLTVLLSAAQLLPTIELTRLTNRAAETVAAHQRLAGIAKLSPEMLFLIGVPQMTFGASLTELWTRFGPVLLALGVLAPVLQPRRAAVWWALGAVVLATTLPFWVIAALPLYSFVRFAAEWSFVAPFAVYLLAALGLDALLARLPRLGTIVAAAATMAALALATWLNWRLVDPRMLGIDMGTPPPMPDVATACDVHDPRYRAYWTIGHLRGSMMNDRVRSPVGYEQSLLPARNADMVKMLGIGNGAVLPGWASTLSRAPEAAARMSLRCLLTPVAPVLEQGGFALQPGEHHQYAQVYVSTRALPRARLEHQTQHAASQDEARDLLARAAPGGVILEGASSDDAAGLPCADDAHDRVEIVLDAPEHVMIRTSSACAAYLVLSDSHLAGWTATVDGAPAPILHADLAFRAVRLPAGDHTVEFRYAAPGLTAGLGLSLLGVVLVAAALLRRPRAR